MFQTFSRNDLPGEAALARGRSVFKKRKKKKKKKNNWTAELGFQKLCKGVDCVDLVKSFPTNISLQNLASIQKRTSPVKFAHFAEKSGKGSISNLSTKAGPAGREMTYKEKKAAEKKKEEDAKRQKGENDAKLVPSKCKHCNAEIKDFWRWDRGDEDATPAFAK